MQYVYNNNNNTEGIKKIIIISKFIKRHVRLQKAAEALVRSVRRSGDSN